MIPSILAALSVLTASTSSQAFDCKKAKTKTEIAICGSESFLKLDKVLDEKFQELNQSYQESPPDKINLKNTQKFWLQLRDLICSSDLDCLKVAYENRIQNLQLAIDGKQTSPIIIKNLIRINRIKSQLQSTIEVKYPEFLNSKSANGLNLNLFSQETLGKDHGCDKGEYFRELYTFWERTNLATQFGSRFEVYCEESAHPANESSTFFVLNSKKQKVDLWAPLKPETRGQLLRLASEEGQKLRSAPGDEDCKSAYEKPVLEATTFSIEIKKGKVLLSPEFPHALNACEESIPISLSEFIKYFKHSPEIMSAVESFRN